MTNASESVNAMLKKKVDYKCSELPHFLHHLKALIDEPEHEIQKAVCLYFVVKRRESPP